MVADGYTSTWSCKKLQKATHGYMGGWICKVTLDYTWLYQVTKEYMQLHEVTQGVTCGYQGYTRLHRGNYTLGCTGLQATQEYIHACTSYYM